MNRYHRQMLLAQIGPAGQERLAAARVLLVGCGALGTVAAEQLARAGVGFLRIVDRDLVELTNLQRQTLFDESDVAEQRPKAIAAERRLRQINSSITIDPVVADLNGGNVEALAGAGGKQRPVDLIIDGTDNAQTRYLLNDVSVKHGIPWVYGACVGMSGRALAMSPPATCCLRCLFPTPPGPGELPTCDTAGVFAPVAAMVASLQVTAAMKILLGAGAGAAGESELFTLDVWPSRLRVTSAADARRADCPACGRREFEFLEGRGRASITLCGQNAVQVCPPSGRSRLNLQALADALSPVGEVSQTPYLLRFIPQGQGALRLTIFPDARVIVHGTGDPTKAASLYARYIGT